VASEGFDEQEAQRRDILADGGRSQPLGLKQMSLILPDLFGPELVGRLVKVLRELADDPDVGFCGTMRVITTLEFLQHLFAKLGHRDLLNFCDPTYLNPSQLLTHVHAAASAAPAASSKSRLRQ
jgi:hypothetical protein